MHRIMPAAVAAATIMFAAGAHAQTQTSPPVGPDWSKIEIKTTDLGQRTYALQANGGNITVAVADDGVIMVDSQFAPLHGKLRAAIAAVSQQPIRYLINTHYHGDHTGGNELFNKDGVAIVAHVRTRDIVASGTIHVNGSKIAPRPDAVPSRTYTDQMILELKGRTAQLKHAAGAHTGGDTYVYFADANVLATGDTVTIGQYPNIDFPNGGNLKGMIAAADAYLALANETTKIVPGHGPVSNKAALTDFRAMLVTTRDRMAKLVADGNTEAEVQALKPFADLDANWAANDAASRNWIRVTYNSLKQ